MIWKPNKLLWNPDKSQWILSALQEISTAWDRPVALRSLLGLNFPEKDHKPFLGQYNLALSCYRAFPTLLLRKKSFTYFTEIELLPLCSVYICWWLMVWWESWHINLFFEGERGPLGGRGRPGEDGLKGAKVRGSCCGWILAEGWLSGFLRTQQVFLRPPNTGVLPSCTGCPAKIAWAEPVIIKTHFTGKLLFKKFVQSVSMSNSVYVGWSEGDVQWGCFLCSYLQGDQGLPGLRGQPGEPGGPGGNVCHLKHHNHQQ